MINLPRTWVHWVRAAITLPGFFWKIHVFRRASGRLYGLDRYLPTESTGGWKSFRATDFFILCPLTLRPGMLDCLVSRP